jgi:hypothetical protein
MGILDTATLAARGFFDDFSMREAEVIFERIEASGMPDAVICDEGKHMVDPRFEAMWIMGNVASAICRAQELTTEARQMFGDPSLSAWWLNDHFRRRDIEMAQETLARATVSDEIRAGCERRLEDAVFYLSNAEWVAVEVLECL